MSCQELKNQIGQLPTARLEEYRNTPVAKLFAAVESLAPRLEPDCCAQPSPCAQCGYNIYINNGFIDGELVSLPSGVIYGSLAAARESHSELVAQYLDAQASKSGDCYSKLCGEFAQDGAFIYVPEGIDVSDPFTIISCYNGAASSACFERSLIVVGEGAKAKFVFDKKTSGDESTPVASEIVETFVGAGAEVETAHICDVKAGTVITHSYTAQQASSRYKSVDMGVSAALSRVNRSVELLGTEAHNSMYGLFVSGSDEIFDYHTAINHIAAGCTSEEHFKDLIAVGGVGVFKGRIYVAQDAQQTEAFQQNNNILLGNGAKIYTKPELEIYADDVKCTHGATIGRPDDEAIYYMRQRGIGEQTARRLQMIGFVNDIVGRCEISCVADQLVDRITTKIENL